MIKIRKALRLSRTERTSRKRRNRVCCSHARKIKVVFVGTEVAPWSKVGGLGDVLSALPIALAEKGHDVMTIAPRYDSYPDIHDTGLIVPITGKTDLDGIERQGMNVARLFCSVVKRVYRVFVDHPVFTREQVSTPEGCRPVIYPYSPTGSDDQFEVGCNVLNQSAIFAPSLIWNQDSKLFRASQNCSKNNQKGCFANDVISTLERLPLGEDWIKYEDSREAEEVMFICNDWPSALLPYFLQSPVHQAILQTLKASKTTNGQISNLTFFNPVNVESNPIGNSKVLFLIHNLDHTGPNFTQSLNKLKIETYPTVQSNTKSYPSNQRCQTERKRDPSSWLEIGLKHSDQVVTVSPSYAEEISNHEIFKKHLNGASLIGITNGIDTSIWNPETDKFLHSNLRFGLLNFQQGKQKAKRFLQRKLGLEIDENSPLFGFIGRLDKQKGVDLLLTAILKFYTNQSSEFHPKAQFVLLGCGDPILESHLTYIKYWFGGKACGISRFSESLAHEITAASDFLLVPSRVEPCGLVTLSALRYGTIPIASGVGGLKDLHQSPPLGLQIMNKTSPVLRGSDQEAERLLEVIKEGVKLHKSEEFEVWRKQCLLKDVSWDNPASQWEDLLFSLS